MNPHCFWLETRADTALLYVLELSTDQGLALFEPCERIRVSAFGASAANGAGWLTESDLPLVQTVTGLRALLRAHAEWDIVDIAVEIGARSQLRTHDDGECHFTLASAHDALRIVERLLPPPLSQSIVEALQKHPAAYVALTGGGIRIYASFDAFLAAEK